MTFFVFRGMRSTCSLNHHLSLSFVASPRSKVTLTSRHSPPGLTSLVQRGLTVSPRVIGHQGHCGQRVGCGASTARFTSTTQPPQPSANAPPPLLPSDTFDASTSSTKLPPHPSTSPPTSTAPPTTPPPPTSFQKFLQGWKKGLLAALVAYVLADLTTRFMLQRKKEGKGNLGYERGDGESGMWGKGDGGGAIRVGSGGESQALKVEVMTDEIFESTDNLMIVLFSSKQQRDLHGPQLVHMIQKAIQKTAAGDSINLYYTMKQEDCPVISENEEDKKVFVMCHKGQRRQGFLLQFDGQGNVMSGQTAGEGPSEVSGKVQESEANEGGKTNVHEKEIQPVGLDKVLSFFIPVSEDLASTLLSKTQDRGHVDVDKSNSKEVMQFGSVKHVTLDGFQKHIVEASSTDHPILLQLMETSCFLCFLMRPFINSLNELFKREGLHLEIRRLNIETNDFPDKQTTGCPVARATPTFVLYKGSADTAERWEEFRPKDLVHKITDTLGDTVTSDVKDELDALLGEMNTRFTTFGVLALWHQERDKLTSVLTTPQPTSPPLTPHSPDSPPPTPHSPHSKQSPPPTPHSTQNESSPQPTDITSTILTPTIDTSDTK
eukprot:GHVN01062286.1.p1 GENE.GHVN01062286.1~~GHVN01062286.1.p1  ORF type:complete len:605 (+),score=186.61 GHVN01062286.1:158-1972(+)